MINETDQRPWADVLYTYQVIVSAHHKEHLTTWPLLNGWDVISARFGEWEIAVLKDAPFSALTRMVGAGDVSPDIIGSDGITAENRQAVVRRLEHHFQARDRDVVFIYKKDEVFTFDYEYMLRRHERAKGLTPMRVFLSHKGADKPKVREFKNTLQTFGFSPWLDEDSMEAGVELERGILKGFNDSCGAVFFITENFRDENYLSTEVNYALAEKRKKADKFSIITLVFDATQARSNVPALLHQYVWKEPTNDLEALREIIRALPIQVGDIDWK